MLALLPATNSSSVNNASDIPSNFLIESSRALLVKDWQKVFGHPAPSGCHISLLKKAIAWQQQAKQHGGLTAVERRQLLSETSSGNGTAHDVHAGARLVRVWQGETHQVTVLADGYLYKDQRWKSLSSIARAITGTPWSGPLFFGLKK